VLVMREVVAELARSPKRESFPFGTSSATGSHERNVPSLGACTTPEYVAVRVGAGIISKARVVEPVREGRRDVTWHASALDRNEPWSAIQQHGDRAEHIRRVGQVARLFADSGAVAVLSLISPLAADREDLRAAHAEAELPFIEVFVDTPLGECERRDPKGLYARARAGEIKGFTGIDAPYEPPERPEIRVRTSETAVEEAVSEIIGRLRPDPRP
jgi:Adenylylsulphate kinase